MFELTLSNDKSKYNFMEFVYAKLKNHVDNSKGLIIFEEMDERLIISLAVPEKEKEFYKAFALELVSEIIIMDYKYEYIKNNLQMYTSNKVLWTAFLKALTVFDKDTDRDLIKKNLVFTNELLIDSSFHFKMHEVKERWREIVSLVGENLAGLVSRDGFVDLMKFLIAASEPEADTVYVKNCKNKPQIMINEYKIARNLCFFEENVENDVRILSELVCLCPNKIVVSLDDKNNENLIEYIKNIFEGKVHLAIDLKSNSNYLKSVDNETNVVYNTKQ